MLKIRVGQAQYVYFPFASNHSCLCVIKYLHTGASESFADIGIITGPGLVISGNIVKGSDLYCAIYEKHGRFQVVFSSINQIPGNHNYVRGHCADSL